MADGLSAPFFWENIGRTYGIYGNHELYIPRTNSGAKRFNLPMGLIGIYEPHITGINFGSLRFL